MPPSDTALTTPEMSPEETAEMTKFGISCTQIQQFHFGEYRYTNLRDAIAQAKRAAKT